MMCICANLQLFGAYLFKDGLLNEIEGMKDEFLNTKQYLKVKNQQNSLYHTSSVALVIVNSITVTHTVHSCS